MKKSIHPDTRETLFRDVMTGETFLVRSTVETAETMLWEDGKEYPVVNVEISSSSHPAYTGNQVEAPQSSRAVQFGAKYSRQPIH
jgi:large subunit ribosomal protein L31